MPRRGVCLRIEGESNTKNGSRFGRLSLAQKGLLVIGLPVIFQILILISLFAIERAHDHDRAADRRSNEVIASSYRLLGLLVDAETGMRGYALTGNPGFTEPYDQ